MGGEVVESREALEAEEEGREMEWNPTWEDPLTSYVKHFDRLMGDQRPRKTFGEAVKGIIAAGSLICQQIAARSGELSRGKKGSQRVIRLASGESTQRSELDAEHLTKRLREVAVEQLAQAPEEELWLIADSSDLRKPYAEVMPYLMDERLVPGYRTLNVLGLTPGRRGLVYHRLISSQAPAFVSEPAEVQQALATVSQALAPLKAEKTVSWLLDSGFDDVAVWRTIWEQDEHLVVRLYHTDRQVAFQDQQGQWHEGDIAQATSHLRLLARVETSLRLKRGKQVRPKQQPGQVELAACPVRVSYWSNVRRPGDKGTLVSKTLWLLQVRVLGVDWEPWLLLTDWPVSDAESATRIFTMYRQRWSVEDAFKFVKTALGWEEVQVLDWQGIRTLVALGFLFDLGVSFEWAEVQLLAKLGGWEPHKDRLPGKITLQRGLSRLLEMLTTQALHSDYAAEHQGLAPRIAAFLHGWQPPGD
jgi:Transposase DDE domain